MSTTLSMWLGIAFLVLAIAAVVLQAWLWGPKFWDDESKRSNAPRSWTNVHRAVGYVYVAIYVVMMWHMVPRLWEYQFELPARTIMHAVAAISIGVILVTKIAILRFFRHFEEAMPKLGFGLLLSTVVLMTLSVPYALRAHDIRGRTLDPGNVERVQRIVGGLELGGAVSPGTLVTRESFSRGREVLVRKCTPCHDLRTILVKPRTGKGWHSVVDRMLDKPSVIGEPLIEQDVPYVTAYLIAITPDIQKSMKRRRASERAKAARLGGKGRTDDGMGEGDEGAASVDGGVREPTAHAERETPLDEAKAAALLEARCTECHEIDEVEEFGGGSREEWANVITRMVEEEDAEVDADEAELIARYLAKRYPKR